MGILVDNLLPSMTPGIEPINKLNTILLLGIGLLLRSIRIKRKRDLNSKGKQAFTI